MEFKDKLKGKVALVAGATRGAGRGIACMLREAGATVFCTGRSLRSQPSDKHHPETIEVTEENWRDAIRHDKYFAYSESPYYVGKAEVASACDRKVVQKKGQALVSGRLAREYGFTDMDGTQPVWCY